MRKRRVFAIASLAAVAITATALAAAPPSGNQQAIAIARAGQRAFAKIPALTESITGSVAMNDAEGKTSFFSWTWNTGVVPRGWVRPTERVALALNKGHVVWARIDLTPPESHCPPGAIICGGPQVPVDIVIDHAGSFFAFGRAVSHTCYTKLHGATPYTVGENLNALIGHFNAPVQSNGAVLLTSTYPSTGRQMATETDTVSTATSLTESGRIKISAGSRGHPAFTIAFTNGYPGTAAPLPQIKRCVGGQLVPG
jgi:hypothetical protein